MPETVRVENYRELMRAYQQADREVRADMRRVFREVGEHVKVDAAGRVAEKSRRSAAGMRVYARQRGIAVGQSLSKTTGLHPEWGAWQMRHALIPARHDGYQETVEKLNRALDQMAREFN